MTSHRFTLSLLSMTLLAPLASSPSLAAPPDALEAWLPDDVIGYVKIQDLGSRLDDFLASELRKEIESMDVARFVMSQDPWQKVQKGLQDFREATGKDALDVLKQVFGREVVLGGRVGFGGPELILLSRGGSESELEGALKLIREAVERRAGQPVQGYSTSREGFSVESFGENLSLSRMGAVLALSNSRSAMENVIDLAAGKSSGSVKASATFQKAGPAIAGNPMACLVLRPKLIPNLQIPEKAENPLGSLLAGGWLGALQGSDLLTATLHPVDRKLELRVASVLGGGQDGLWKKIQSFFPEVSPTGLVESLEKRGVLGVLQVHRNLGEWWASRDSLISPDAMGGLYQFSQLLSMALGGLDLEGQILPEVRPSMTIVARNQEYAGAGGKPKPAIPGFAAIFEHNGGSDTTRIVTTAFHTIAGFINSDRVMKGQEAGTVKAEKVGDADLCVFSLPEKDDKLVAANFSPSVAVVGQKVILSSCAELAKILAEEVQKPLGGAPAAKSAKDSLMVDSGAIESIVSDNLDLIVADNMRKKGVSREKAEGEMKAVLEILRLFKDLRGTSGKEGDSVEVRLELRLRSAEPAGTRSRV
jgi:hypothetical protein